MDGTVLGASENPSFEPFVTDDYELIDFGDSRRLERFGSVILDRPSPAAEGPPLYPDRWSQAHARFERTRGNRGRWVDRCHVPERWTIRWGPLVLELKRNESGHVGLFPEQVVNWSWLYHHITQSEKVGPVLNLFAYTGGSTLAAALAGAEVVHVDAARNVVAWAKRNAVLSGLENLPIHWIVEDARKFLRREVRRERRYWGIILDPPTYGHGPRGESFQLEKDIVGLLEAVFALLDWDRGFLLMTCHTPGYGTQKLTRLFHDLRPDLWQRGQITVRMMTIPSSSGRPLPSGMVVRWQSSPPR
ncbi:MAG: class I SAM-dependent methyltransferase [Thermogutta sp.]|nr:class I SAM-dependent methyltransferase [Thermogutta sp.]HOP76579.1 class I SAM-dependent methyltransferase [Thermogutta sp.]HPZ82029.1 class I SAM-dependent methyltransferase [Thermogutta sp.]